MSKFFYSRLAVTNIRKNAQTYIPYVLSCIGTVMMYYIMNSLAFNSDIKEMPGGQTLVSLLSLGVTVITLFAIIFLFYTNSFLMKRRKKEFGLYNILGMEKKHIGRIIFIETVYVSILSLILGILGGIIFSKLMYLLLLKILDFEVKLGIYISKHSILSTLILFGIIFLINLLNTLRQVHLANPIKLLKGTQVGEKEPKTKWVLVVIGLICLGIGYYIALSTDSPIEAFKYFFLAVILVIIGTYCLFIAISIAILKALRNNKKYYYHPTHFTTVSGMIYRMKQNAAGLASICILATIVLVVVSSTVSLYIGIEEVMKNRYPYDIMINVNGTNKEDISHVDTKVRNFLWNNKISGQNGVKFTYIPLLGTQDKNKMELSTEFNYSATKAFNFMTIDDLNKNKNTPYTLNKGEIIIYSNRGNYGYDTLEIFGKEYKVKEEIEPILSTGIDSALIFDTIYVIVDSEETLTEIYKTQEGILGQDKIEYLHFIGFDLDMDKEEEIEFVKKLTAYLEDEPVGIESASQSKDAFYSLYGGLFFLGIFLSILFIMATVLIIYYKQISEGYDDKNRFEIMQNVGMSKEEVRKTIKDQVLTVFFLPLIIATIHIAFAFKVITKLLELLNLTNVPLFALCTLLTLLVFAVFYALIYRKTAKVYYKIVTS